MMDNRKRLGPSESISIEIDARRLYYAVPVHTDHADNSIIFFFHASKPIAVALAIVLEFINIGDYKLLCRIASFLTRGIRNDNAVK